MSANPKNLGASILVVDDVPANLRLLAEILANQGYRVRPVSEARLALASAQVEPPDLIVLDILMPGMSGYEVCERLKADEQTRDIPVIFTSALHEVADKVRAFSVGGVDYITKPFQVEEVLIRVTTHLTLRNLQKDLQQKNALLQQEIRERERVEASLRESEERYRRLVELSPEAIMVRQGSRFVYANVAAVKLFAANSSENLIGRSIMDFVHPDYLEAVKQQVRKIFEERKLTPLTEQKLVRLDGQAIDVEVAGAPITYQGEPATQVVIRDVTERKQTQKFIQESEKRYRSIFENATTGIFQVTLHGKFTTANPALARILGYASIKELMRTVTNIAEQVYVVPQHWYDITSLVQGIQEPVKVESRCRCKDGREILVNLTIWAVRDEQDETRYFEGFLEDITEHKQMEEALVKERNLLHTLINSTPDFIYVKDTEHRFLLANNAMVRSMGLTMLDNLIGKTDFDFYPVKLAKRYYADEQTVVKTGQPLINREEPHFDPETGAMKWFLTTKMPLRDAQNNIVGFVGINHDITERKRAEEILFTQATLLRSVAGAMTCLLVKTDFRSAITQALELLGFATEVDRIYIFENHPHPETDEMLMSQRFEWVQDASEAQIENPKLQNLPYHPQFSRWYKTLRANKTISGLVREFPQSERVLLEAQNILSTIIVPIMIQEQFWGFIGFDACHTERQWREEEESILFAMAGSIGGAIARQQTEVELIAANKELIETLEDLQRTQTQLILAGKMAALGQLVASIAHEINTPLGAIQSSIRNIVATLDQILEHLPTFFRTLSAELQQEFLALLKRALHKDVTLSASEERQFKHALVETLRAYHLDNAAKIADTLVNMGVYENVQPFLPLLKAPDYPRILNMAYQLSGLHESTQIITAATDRASKVVVALKTYARHDQSGEMIEADITEGIETVLTLHYSQYKHGVEVIREYEALRPILCYPDELNQVWANLIHNALQAMDYKGTLTIAVRKRGEQILVSITDTGRGIPDELQSKIFEPFFTTKLEGEGSGLGLNIATKVIAKHRGTITFDSQPGKTTFYVSLPIRSQAEDGTEGKIKQ
jgi:PAS domain S-box-containing protein